MDKLIALLLVGSVAACGPDASPSSSSSSPGADPGRAAGGAASVDGGVAAAPPSAADSQNLSRWAARLASAVEVGRLGALDTEGDGVALGEISDVSTGPDGRIYVLDYHFHDVKVFGPDGAHVGTIGRAGRGPGELVQPRAMAWSAPDTFVLADGTRRAHLFGVDRDGSARYVRSVPTHVAVESMCGSGGSLLVHGTHPESFDRVHALDLSEGGATAGFAPGTRDDHEIRARRRNEGHMDCLPGGTVALTSDYFSDVDVWVVGGGRRWTRAVPSFVGMAFTVLEGGGLRQGVAEGAEGFDRIVGVVGLDRSTFLVQTGWQTVQSSRDGLSWKTLKSRVYSADTGESIEMAAPLPLVLEVTPAGFLGAVELPYPQVVRYRFAGADSGAGGSP